MRHRAASKSSDNFSLPEWMFEVDEYDEMDSSDTNILEELDIDVRLTCSILFWSLLIPLSSCARRKRDRHPLRYRPSHSLWGPTCVMALYAAILWIAKLPNATWVFGIVLGASIFQHLTARVFITTSPVLHTVILAYSIFPLVPFAIIDILVRPQYLYALLGEIVSVLWATFVGYTAYCDVFGPPDADTSARWSLLMYPILFMNIYLISLLPYADD